MKKMKESLDFSKDASNFHLEDDLSNEISKNYEESNNFDRYEDFLASKKENKNMKMIMQKSTISNRVISKPYLANQPVKVLIDMCYNNTNIPDDLWDKNIIDSIPFSNLYTNPNIIDPNKNNIKTSNNNNKNISRNENKEKHYNSNNNNDDDINLSNEELKTFVEEEVKEVKWGPRGKKYFNLAYLHLKDIRTGKKKLPQISNDDSSQLKFLYKCDDLNIAPDAALAIAKSAANTKHVKMTNCGMNGNFSLALCETLKGNCEVIQSLNLSSNQMQTKYVVKIIKSLHEGALMKREKGEISTLSKIDLSNNNFGISGAFALQQFVSSHSLCNLIDINLKGANLSCSGAKLICLALEKNNKVNNIDLSRNKIGIIGGICLGNMIRRNKSLKKINLSWNNISKEAGIEIGEAIAINEYLTDVDISWNALKDEGGGALGSALTSNKTLLVLDLSYNTIGQNGALQIAEGISNNNTLSFLMLEGNNMEEGMKKISEAVNIKIKNANNSNNRSSSNGKSEVILEVSYETSKLDAFTLANDKDNKKDSLTLNLRDITARTLFGEILKQHFASVGGRVINELKIDNNKIDMVSLTPVFKIPISGMLMIKFKAKGTLESSGSLPLHTRKMSIASFDSLKKTMQSISTGDESGVGKEVNMFDVFSQQIQYSSYRTEDAVRLVEMFKEGWRKVQAVCLIYFKLLDINNSEHLFTCLTKEQEMEAKGKLGVSYLYDSRFPSGHYILDAKNSHELNVLKSLMTISGTERKLKKESNLPDCSVKGNRESFRNVTHNGNEINFSSKSDIPYGGPIEFDFACYRDNVMYAKKMDDLAFFNFAKNVTHGLYDMKDAAMKSTRTHWEAKFLSTMKGSTNVDVITPAPMSAVVVGRNRRRSAMSLAKNVKSIHTVSISQISVIHDILIYFKLHNISISVHQLSILIEALDGGYILSKEDSSKNKIDLICHTFDRIYNISSFGELTSKLTPIEFKVIKNRMGILNIINFFEPLGHFELNLTQYDEWICANSLFQLRVIEEGYSDMINLKYNGPPFDEFPSAAFEIPRNWLREGLPKVGKFSFSFICVKRSNKPDLVARQFLTKKNTSSGVLLETSISEKDYYKDHFSHAVINKMESIFKPLRNIILSLHSGSAAGAKIITLPKEESEDNKDDDDGIIKNVLSLLAKDNDDEVD